MNESYLFCILVLVLALAGLVGTQLLLDRLVEAYKDRCGQKQRVQPSLSLATAEIEKTLPLLKSLF